MASFSFDLPAKWPTDPREILERAWISGGYDNAPVPVRRRFDDRTLELVRDENESGSLSLEWPVRGEPRIVATAHACERFFWSMLWFALIACLLFSFNPFC